MSSRHTSASAAILVTGGGTGIGAAVTRELRAAGNEVAILGRAVRGAGRGGRVDGGAGRGIASAAPPAPRVGVRGPLPPLRAGPGAG